MYIDLNTEDISALPDKLINTRGKHDVLFCDNVLVSIPRRTLILNAIFWEPNYIFGVRPIHTDYSTFKSMTVDVVAEVQSKLWERLIVEKPNIPHSNFSMAYAYNRNRLSNFIQEHTGCFMPTIDALGLAQTMHYPPIKKILDRKIVTNMGTKVAEQSLEDIGNDLVHMLRITKSDHNCLYPYMRAQTIKMNQVPPFFKAFGTRSDIDDTMMSHIVTSSSFEGLKNIADMAIEYLSAKKATYFSHDVIKDAQYFARKLSLVNATMMKLYRGSCGSPGWIPFTIKQEYAKWYLNRIIIDSDSGERVILSPSNIAKYVDTTVKLVSQFACRHTDGMCEACAGYAHDRLYKYLPVGLHIGIWAEFLMASMISQNVLSTKHLIIGITLVYMLSEMAKRHLEQRDTSLYFKVRKDDDLSSTYIRVPRRSMQQIADLNCRMMPNVESFSSISYFELVKDGSVIERVDLNYGAFIPYFSKDMLKFMKQNLGNIIVTKDYVDIPLAGYKQDVAMFAFTALNDDMRAFVSQVTDFMSKSISRYTSIPIAIENFSQVVYKKIKINSFFLETVLRSHLIAGQDDYRLPIVTDPFNVTFGKMADVISNRTICDKFVFERMNEYIKKPGTPLQPKAPGWFAPAFGFIA